MQRNLCPITQARIVLDNDARRRVLRRLAESLPNTEAGGALSVMEAILQTAPKPLACILTARMRLPA
jgi:hypothetical protein